MPKYGSSKRRVRVVRTQFSCRGGRHEAESELCARREHGCCGLRSARPPIRPAPSAISQSQILRPIRGRDAVRGHRGVEGPQTRRPALRAVNPPAERCVRGRVRRDVDEQLDPSLVVERDGTLAVPSTTPSKKIVGFGPPTAPSKSAVASRAATSSPSTWCESNVSSASSRSTSACVHQHHAVAGLLQPSLRSLERRGVERLDTSARRSRVNVCCVRRDRASADG